MQLKTNYAHEIAIIVCSRFFKNKGHQSLPTKFWNDARFTRDYKLQIMRAYSLLKMYSGEAILAALKTKEGQRIWSLTAPWLDAIIAREQHKINSLEKKITKSLETIKGQDKQQPIEIPINHQPVKPFQTKKSILDKLDGEKEN